MKLQAPAYFITTQQVAQVELQHSAIISVRTPSRHIEGAEIQLHSFLILALDRCSAVNLTPRPHHLQ
jgi:hypothetical protein